jgi:hypothetical protein
MAKKQTRRSISVSRTTYERLKAFCEANNVSMSQLVETRVNDFLGDGVPAATTIPSSIPAAPRPVAPVAPRPMMPAPTPKQETAPIARPTPAAPIPMTSAAARFAVDPPPPIIKPKQADTNAPKPAEKRPDQIFTF